MQDTRRTSKPTSQEQTNAATSSLPAIAPRYQLWPDLDAFDKVDLTASTKVNVPRTRLPPRSRFGCWTCRTRKVKCDEARPACTPCSRLGHTCDYNPRLSFKDDTPRVAEKLSCPGKSRGPVWDPSVRPVKRQRISTLKEDRLPPFSSLSNDEDRERKAEYRMPGTYHVVVNPSSFAEYEEYWAAHDESNPLESPLSKASGYARNEKSTSAHFYHHNKHSDQFQDISNDPDVVVLKVFEDDTQRAFSPGGLITKHGGSSRTPTLSTPLSASAPTEPTKNHFEFSYNNTPLMRMVPKDGRDHQLIYYYKTFVHRHLAQVHRDTLGTSLETGALSAPDVFETQAAKYLPLYHALMAFSALSMSCKTGSPNLDALQHYQKALPSLQASLRTEEDLASDGVFLTHFLLLLYEIAAGEARGLSLWSQHISQLLRIILLRRERYAHEPYGFIVWWVANIDVHAVLSGMGNGEFVETMLQRNLLPSGLAGDNHHHHHHHPSGDITTLNEHEALPSALAFHWRLSTLAAELGLMARDMRAEEQRNPDGRSPATIRSRQERTSKLQDTLRRTWNVQMPASVANGYCNQVLPVGARGIFEHSFALYRALLIYSHTSMYPSQRTSPYHIHEVAQSAGEIVRLARDIVRHGHLERKFIIFPLFMAGLVARTRPARAEILALVARMEEDSVGRNMAAARVLLEICFEREGEGRAGAGEGGVVDWVGVVAELGLQVVNCRL